MEANTVIPVKYNSMESALKLYVVAYRRMLWAVLTNCTSAAATGCTMAAATGCMRAVFDCIRIAWGRCRQPLISLDIVIIWAILLLTITVPVAFLCIEIYKSDGAHVYSRWDVLSVESLYEICLEIMFRAKAFLVHGILHLSTSRQPFTGRGCSIMKAAMLWKQVKEPVVQDRS